jgi:two-component system sensor histidine kinase ResE
LDLEEERKQWRAQLSKAEASYMSLRAHNRQLQDRLARDSQQQPDALNTAALDSIPHGIIVCNTQGQVVHANPIAAQKLSLQQAAWKGQDAVSLWPDSEWQAAVHAVTDQYSTEAPPVNPLQMDRPLHGLQIALSPLWSEGQHTGAVIVLQDMAALDERTRARDEFLSSLAHELRTPMTSILGYTELLMSESVGKLEGMQRKFLQRVQANIERMGAMLNDLIGVTAIDSGKLDIELEPVDVVRVVESALRKIQFRLEERELNTHIEIGDISPISADPEHLQQMVDNLLTNACTSSAAGTTINIIAHQETDETGRSHLHVAVSDTGGGISPEDRARVFERFYRADNALVKGLGETGVGLSIVKALVEAHHGHVWIESRLGEGTTFHFTIPFDLEQRMRGNRNSRLAIQRRSAGDNGHT